MAVLIALAVVVVTQPAFAETEETDADHDDLSTMIEDAIDECGCNLNQTAEAKFALVEKFRENQATITDVKISAKLLRWFAVSIEIRHSKPTVTASDIIGAWEECVEKRIDSQTHSS